MPITYDGNTALLDRDKTAFFCSRAYSAGKILPCLDWANHLPADACIISTFRSPIEKNVLDILLRRHISVIMVIARRPYRLIPTELREAYQSRQLLFVSTTPDTQTRRGQQTCLAANRYIVTIAQQVVFGFVAPNSNTEKLYNLTDSDKVIHL